MVFPLLLDKRGAGIDDGEGGGDGYGPEQTLTLQPDETTGEDTTIRQASPTTNFNGTGWMEVGSRTGGDLWRSLIKFDLSSIPVDAIVVSATLSLYLGIEDSANARTMRVFRLLRAWVEAQATWNAYSTGNNWQTAGGFGALDCEQTDVGSREFSATEATGEFKDFVLTPSAVQEWISGNLANNGLLVKVDTETAPDNYKVAGSHDTTAANRPKLEVVYQVPL